MQKEGSDQESRRPNSLSLVLVIAADVINDLEQRG